MGLSIGDVEKITGISKDRLRYYEEKQKICNVFKRRQEELQLQMAQLQYQKDIVSRSIEDCEKISEYLGNYTLKKVRPLRLIDKIDSIASTETGAKFKTESDEQMIIIRSLVRRIELNPEGIGENAVFVAEETGEEDIECVYTVVRDSADYDPLMDEYAKCMQWVRENNIRLGRYCYIRPLLVSHLGKSTESFLEVFAPIEK